MHGFSSLLLDVFYLCSLSTLRGLPSTVDDNAPPAEWKLTPLLRTLMDFEVLLNSPAYAPFFRNIETLSGLLGEQKRIARKIQLLYFATFLGACLVLLGPLPPQTKVSLWGVETPISIIPQQIISLITAAAYAQYIVHFTSLLTLSEMIRRILQREYVDSWQFFAARFDATTLWAASLTPKQIGYRSPKRHLAVAILILSVSFGTVVAHSIAVCASTVLALWSAWESNSTLLMVMAVAAAIMAAVSFLSLLAFVTWRMPFRIVKSAPA